MKRQLTAISPVARVWSTSMYAEKMQEVLTDIQDGTFARQWIDENKIRTKRIQTHDERRSVATRLRKVGADLRSRMDWLEN